jgi:hypothetical protein
VVNAKLKCESAQTLRRTDKLKDQSIPEHHVVDVTRVLGLGGDFNMSPVSVPAGEVPGSNSLLVRIFLLAQGQAVAVREVELLAALIRATARGNGGA